MSARRAAIRAIRSHLPAGVLTNEQLAREFQDWEVEKIYAKTGIASRGVAAAGECASDLGVAAVQRLFGEGLCRPEEVDFLIFCTQSPDHFLPPSACLMQARLGLSTACGALDLNLGCSGFIYGLSLAKGLIETGQAALVLLVTADTYTKFIHPRDRGVRTLFGDGAAATLIAAQETAAEAIGPFVFGTDGRGGRNLMVPAGGLREPRSQESAVEYEDGSGAVRSREHLFMDGPEIFNFSLQEVPRAVRELLARSGKGLEEIDYVVFHQANRFMLEALRKKLRLPPEKFCINMETYGNTVSATIPMAMELARERGEMQGGDLVLLVGFGVGYSWGATLVRV